MTLFGEGSNHHRLFADHIAGAETWVRTEGHGRVVQEWNVRPSRPDNHWFDCLVGCAAAASMEGIKLGVERIEASKPRRKFKLSELQASKR